VASKYAKDQGQALTAQDPKDTELAQESLYQQMRLKGFVF
jgi:hypothetical protein